MSAIDYKIQNAKAINDLVQSDTALEKIYKQIGLPNFWIRANGFSGLLQIILEQQVSLASAKAVFEKLLQINPDISPNNFLKISNTDLRRAGFSKQKLLYCRNLAEEILYGNLDFEQIALLPDEQVKDRLMRIKGIGNWTADCYLIFCLNRADIWPACDLALNRALKVVKNLKEIPNKVKSADIAKVWIPWRSAAARLLWHYYLSNTFPKSH